MMQLHQIETLLDRLDSLLELRENADTDEADWPTLAFSAFLLEYFQQLQKQKTLLNPDRIPYTSNKQILDHEKSCKLVGKVLAQLEYSTFDTAAQQFFRNIMPATVRPWVPHFEAILTEPLPRRLKVLVLLQRRLYGILPTTNVEVLPEQTSFNSTLLATTQCIQAGNSVEAGVAVVGLVQLTAREIVRLTAHHLPQGYAAVYQKVENSESGTRGLTNTIAYH